MVKFNVLEFIILVHFSSLLVYGSLWNYWRSSSESRLAGSSSRAARDSDDAAVPAVSSPDDIRQLQESLSAIAAYHTFLPKKFSPTIGRIFMITSDSPATEGTELISELHRILQKPTVRFDRFPERHPQLILLWKCSFQAIDTLLKYQLVSQAAVAEFFENAEIVSQVIHYALGRFEESRVDVGKSPYLTEHWYWPLIHDSFQALREDQKTSLNAVYLFKFQHQKMLNPWTHLENQSLKKFLHSSKKWETYMKSMQRNHQHPPSSDMVKEDLAFIIKTIAGLNFNYSQLELGFHLQYIMDFITRYISPGITEETIEKLYESKDSKLKLEMVKLDCEILDTSLKGNSYRDYMQIHHPPNVQRSNDRLVSAFDIYRIKVHQLIKSFKTTSDKMLSSPTVEDIWRIYAEKHDAVAPGSSTGIIV